MSNKPVDLLIVTALPEELEIIRSYLPKGDKLHSQHCELTYDLGSLKTDEGAFYLYGLTCLFQMGNTDAGVSTAQAIRDLNPTYVFMFGLAAGVKGQVALTDVIIPTHIFYYEQAKLRPGVVEIRPQSYQADALLSNKLKDFASSIAADYQIKFGPFAVGEKVVADTQIVDNLKKSEPKLLGIEMESYGVARAAAGTFYRPRFIAIRGVSDFADEQKDDDCRAQALHNAAEFFARFLKTGVLPKTKAQFTKSETSQTLIAIHHLSLNLRTSVKQFIKTSIPQYQDCDIQELFINQVDLYKNGSLTNPTEALQRQYDLLQQLNNFTNHYPEAHLAYFGLAHIPFIFHAGYQINRRAIKVFATNRQTGEWIALKKSGSGPKLLLQETSEVSSDVKGDIILRMSISYMVRPQQIQEVVKQPMASFHLSLAKPKPDAVISEKQLNRYASTFHQVLVDINARFPNTQRIHLFLAAPPTLVFRCGQQVSKTIDPDILVYNFSNKDQPNYGWAINMMTGEIIEHRNIQ